MNRDHDTHEASATVRQLEDQLTAAQSDRTELRKDASFFRTSATAWQEMGDRLWKLLTGQKASVYPSILEAKVREKLGMEAKGGPT